MIWNGEKMQSVKLQNATEKAFGAVFLFLPISKPLLFISLFVALLLLVASGGFIKAIRSWRTLPWVAPALVLAILPLLSLIVHRHLGQQTSYLDLSYYWSFALIAFLAASQMRILPWMRMFLCGVFLVFCYTQLLAIGWWPFDRAPSASANSILYSQFLAVGIVLLSILFKHEDRRRGKIVYLIGIGLFSVGLVSGNGRTGMLIVVVLLPFISSNLFKHHNLVKFISVCLVASIVMLMSPKVQTRIEAAVKDVQLFQTGVTETSIGHRFEMWKTAWDVFRAHPLIGASPVGFVDAWDSTPRMEGAKAFVEPHNAFMFFASSYGSIGLGALIWLYAALLWTGWIHRQRLEGGIVFAFAVTCIVASLTNTLFMGAVSHAWVMLFIGLQGSLMLVSPKAVSDCQQKVAQA